MFFENVDDLRKQIWLMVSQIFLKFSGVKYFGYFETIFVGEIIGEMAEGKGCPLELDGRCEKLVEIS